MKEPKKMSNTPQHDHDKIDTSKDNSILGKLGILMEKQNKSEQNLDDLIDAVTTGNPDLKNFDCSVFTGEYITGESESYFTDLESKRNDAKKGNNEDRVAIDMSDSD